MVRIPGFHCCGPGSVPGQGTEIPQAVEHSQKTNKQTNYCLANKSVRVFLYHLM